MSRIDDADVRRLAAALSPGTHAVPTRVDVAEAQSAQLERAQAALRSHGGDEALGRSLTQALAAYLNRPVRATVGGGSGTIPDAWRYVAESGAMTWWIEFEVPLAAGLADAMLGGSGSGAGAGSKHTGGRRARALVAKTADVFFRELASAAQAVQPPGAAKSDATQHADLAQLTGHCAVATQPFAWRAGVALRGIAAEQIRIDRTLPAPPVWVPIAAEQPRVDAAQKGQTIVAMVKDMVAAACAAAHDVLRCPVAVSVPVVTEVDSPELPEAALRLALTTGGQGALVVCAQRDAVVAFASGIVGARVPDSADTGAVVSAAAEAGLREIVAGIASRLPRLSGEPQRVVHLAPDAQLTRVPHIAASVTLHVAGSAAGLRVLVPRWMIEAI